MATASYVARDLKGPTVSIKVSLARMLRLRVWVGLWVARLGFRIMGLKAVLQVEGPK